MILLNYRSSRPIYLQIADGLRLQIRSGILQPGDRLPSVRELAAELSINPNTIQRSYRELEAEGWTVSIPGKGNFVCEGPGSGETEKQKLLDQFDDTAKKLLRLGMSPVELIARLTTMGGGTNA